MESSQQLRPADDGAVHQASLEGGGPEECSNQEVLHDEAQCQQKDIQLSSGVDVQQVGVHLVADDGCKQVGVQRGVQAEWVEDSLLAKRQEGEAGIQ